jgi:RNA polymerase sigma factor (sigma-70 family)
MTFALLHLVRSACRPDRHGEADAALLDRFARTRDEASFAELVRRHGAMVYGLSRRWLGSTQDAEDCFQAAFLTLARKADSIRVGQALPGWLFRVTRRLALRLRRQNAARGQVVPLEDVAMADPAQRTAELRELLAAEIERLPDRYAAPLVLHYLEGKTLAETARQLGWKQGTVSGRVSRALARLRSRLARQGITLSVAALASLASQTPASPSLTLATTRAAVAFVAGDVSAFAPQVVRLSNGILPLMTALPARFLAGVFAVLACAGLSVAGLLVGVPAGKQDRAAKPAQAAEPVDLPAGAFARLGRRRGQTLADLIAAVKAVVYTPDGKVLATTDGYDGIRIWDAESGKALSHIPVKGPHLYGLSFSPDGKRIAWGGNQGVAVLGVSEVATGKPLWKIQGSNYVTFAPDGRYVIGSVYTGDPLVVEAATGKVVYRLAEPGWVAVRSAVSRDGLTVATAAQRRRDPRGGGGSSPSRIEIWDVATGRLRKHFPPTDTLYPNIQSVVLSPDGKTVGYGKQSRFALVEAATGKERLGFDLGAHSYWNFAHFTPDGKGLLVFSSRYTPDSGGHTTTIELLDAATGAARRRFDGTSYQFGQGVFSPDGRRLVSFGESVALQVWDVASGRVLPAYDGHRVGPRQLALDAAGKTLASADHLHCVCVWDVPARKLKRRLDLGSARSIDLSADGSSLLVTAQNSQVVLFDLADGSSRRLHLRVHQARRSPDGRLAACVNYDGALDILDIPTGKVVRRCVGHRGEIHTVSFSRDGARLLSAARTPAQLNQPVGDDAIRGRRAAVVIPDDTVRLWDVREGKQLFQWELAAEAAVLSADGRVMYAGDAKGLVRRLDTATGKELPPLRGHQAPVRLLARSRDGRRLASLDNAAGLLLWDTATGKQVRRMEIAHGRGEGIAGVALSGDGSRLATSSFSEGTILLWDVAGGK